MVVYESRIGMTRGDVDLQPPRHLYPSVAIEGHGKKGNTVLLEIRVAGQGADRAVLSNPEGSSSQHARFPVPKSMTRIRYGISEQRYGISEQKPHM